jgi:hypothetical protein
VLHLVSAQKRVSGRCGHDTRIYIYVYIYIAHVENDAWRPRPLINSWLIWARGNGRRGSMVPWACQIGTPLAAADKLAAQNKDTGEVRSEETR